MKNLLLISIIIVFIMTFSANIYSKNMLVNINFSQFKSESQTNVEFYYSFPDTVIKFIYQKDGVYLGKIYFEMEFSDNIGVTKSEKWIVPINITDYNGTHKQIFYGQKSFLLNSGQYKVKVLVKDEQDSLTKANIEIPLIVRKFEQNSLSISDIELATLLEKKETSQRNWDKMFEKPGYFVIPNPASEYNDNFSSLLFYNEIYNAKTIAPDGYIIDYVVTRPEGQEKLRYSQKKESSYDAIAGANTIPLDLLETGVYYFNIVVKYPISKPTDSIKVQKKFFYFNRYKTAETTNNFVENLTFEKSEFSTFTKARVEEEIEMLKIICTENERKSINSLNTDIAKQRFLFKFWSLRDPDTNTVVNEKRQEFLQNVEFANLHFRWGKTKDGWKTDRGKILLKYGKPTDIKYNNSVSSTSAYDEWFYEGLYGGCRFIFVDSGGYGNYQYVHSTAPGERYNPNWYYQYIEKTTDTEFNKTNPYQGTNNGGMW